jgi:hypothetical protein
VQERRRRGEGSRQLIATGSFYGTICDVPTLHIAQDDAADELLSRDSLALLVGTLLDQHMTRGAEEGDPGRRRS